MNGLQVVDALSVRSRRELFIALLAAPWFVEENANEPPISYVARKTRGHEVTTT